MLIASGYFSNGYEKSMNYSFATIIDNETYYEYYDAENFDIFELKPKLYSVVANIILKGKYEFGLEYLFNTSFVNGYNLPYRGSYNYIYFKYHLKEKQNFPLNLSFNMKYGESASFRHNNNYIFNSRSTGFSIYKEFFDTKYPLIPVFSFDKNSTFINSITLTEYYMITIDLLIKLTVNNLDNDKMRDIIWLGPKITIIDNDQSIGFTFGLYHPIK